MVCAKSQTHKIDELAGIVHPRDGHPKIYAMIDAYLDESGIHDGAAVCVISGYYCGRGQWRKFEALWRKTLAQFNVPLEKFHAKNLVKRRGFFDSWNDQIFTAFLDALASAIIEYKIHPVTVGVVIADFFSFSHSQRRFLTGARLEDGKLISSGAPGKPYFCPFQECVARVAESAPVGGKAHFFFGLDRPFAGYAHAFMDDILAHPYARVHNQIGRSPAFPLAKETPQLQAADLLAYVSYLDMTDRLKNNSWDEIPDTYLRLLIENRKCMNDFCYFEKNAMQIALNRTYELTGNWDGHLDIST